MRARWKIFYSTWPSFRPLPPHTYDFMPDFLHVCRYLPPVSDHFPHTPTSFRPISCMCVLNYPYFRPLLPHTHEFSLDFLHVCRSRISTASRLRHILLRLGVKVLQAFALLTPCGGNKASSDAPRRPCICAANTARPGALVRREPV